MSEGFTTSRGVTVKFVGIASLLDKLNGQFHLPDAPFYEITTATGAKEKHLHDDTTVQTDEERAALAAYKVEIARLNAEQQAKLTRLVLLRGITFDYPTDEMWVKEQAYLGIQVPDEPMDRRLHYIETEVIANAADVEAITLGVMEASGVPEEMVRQMAESFRHSLGESNGHEAGGPDPDGNGLGMVLQPEIRTGASGVSDGKMDERVRRRKSRR